MNDKITISTAELFRMFPDQETARTYLESRLWPNGCRCPVCGLGDRITARAGGYYRCNQCKEDFTVRTGTIFERSHVPLHKWLHAMYLLLTARKGISSMQLSKELSITQKSAWFVLQRLREACGKQIEALSGIVEIDETYIGGKEANKHVNKRLNRGRGAVGKEAVLGMRERGGRTIAMHIEDVNTATLHRAIHTNIEAGSTLHTDDAATYHGLNGLFFKNEINPLRNALVTAALAALVGACATQETAPPVVKQAVAEPPCSAQKLPARPVFPADTLTGDESIWVLGTTMWADRKARRAYEAALEVFAQECTRPAGSP